MASFIRCQNYLINTSSIRSVCKIGNLTIRFVLTCDGKPTEEYERTNVFGFDTEEIRDREFERIVSELMRSSDNIMKNVVGISSLDTSNASGTSSVTASSSPAQ